VLRDCLQRGDRGLPRRFFRASARNIRVAWQTAVGSDLSLPEVVGPRPMLMRISNSFLERVMVASETDPIVTCQFMRVTSMIDSPIRLLRPNILLRIIRVKRRPREPQFAHAAGRGRSADPQQDAGGDHDARRDRRTAQLIGRSGWLS
jgi:hypothetical protein